MVETVAGIKSVRGKKVTKIVKKKLTRVGGQKKKFNKDLVSEVMGFTPYERRALELLRNQRDKRALKYLKSRIGDLRRAKKKREDLSNIIMQSRH